MILKIDFKVKFKVINGCLPLNPTIFVRVIFRYHLYLRSYLRGWIKMAHPVQLYIKYVNNYIFNIFSRVFRFNKSVFFFMSTTMYDIKIIFLIINIFFI